MPVRYTRNYITPPIRACISSLASPSQFRSEQMDKRLVNPDRLYDSSPFGMSQAVVDTASSLVFVSGQVDWDHQYQVSHSSFPGQLEAALENVRTALVAAGASVGSLLHVRIYVRGELEEHMESLAPILTRFLGDSRPAVTGIGVVSLASKALLVEVEAVAKAEKAA